jgi:hypothetical protein
MALYQVHFYDFGENIRAVHDIEHDDDESAIAAAHRLNVLPHVSASFEVWNNDRLVHRHRNS